MRNRTLKSIKINPVNEWGNETSVEDIEKNPHFKETVFSELVESIKCAVKQNKKVASLVELNNSGNVVELIKENWFTALSNSLTYYEEKENFEKCVVIRNLIQLTNEGTQQSSNRNKQYSKNKNTVKKKKEKLSVTK